jgi:hypothetical protein
LDSQAFEGVHENNKKITEFIIYKPNSKPKTESDGGRILRPYVPQGAKRIN